MPSASQRRASRSVSWMICWSIAGSIDAGNRKLLNFTSERYHAFRPRAFCYHPDRHLPMRIEPIDDPADPRVADYRDIKDAELRRRRGLFVAESRAVVRGLLASARFRTRSVLLTAPALDSLREALQAADAPIYLTSHEVARAVVGFDFHRGCVALGERGVEPSLEALVDRPGPRLVLALEDVSNPDNVGGVFRNARAFGADAILLSAGCADPLYRKAIRTSMGASLVTPFAHLPDWADGLARLRKAGYTLVALTPDPSALDIARLGAGRACPLARRPPPRRRGPRPQRRDAGGRRPPDADRDGARRGLAQRRDGGRHRAPPSQVGRGAVTRRHARGQVRDSGRR